MASETVTENTHDLPSYSVAISRIYNSARRYWVWDKDYSIPLDFFRDIQRFGHVTRTDIQLVVGLAILWTILRYFLTWTVFLPFARSMRLIPINQSKFPESAWKTLFYSCTWMTSIYVLFVSERYTYFHKPLMIWTDWHPRMPVPTDIYCLYAVQFSFYLHSVYGTLCMDRWRKDSIVMLFHHFLTMSLIGFSFATRYHKIGVLVLYMMDVTDICLEFTKCNVYFKNRGGKYYAIHDHLSTVGFLFFAGTWYLFRLYWFPLKVLYSSTYGVDKFGPSTPLQFYLFFNVMLWILLALNIYWFFFILNFIYKVATGQMKEVDDLRETEVEEKYFKKPHSPVANGSAKVNHNSNDVQTTNHVKIRSKAD